MSGYKCRRCGGDHQRSCCHPSRHTLCDECVRDNRRHVAANAPETSESEPEESGA